MLSTVNCRSRHLHVEAAVVYKVAHKLVIHTAGLGLVLIYMALTSHRHNLGQNALSHIASVGLAVNV